MLPDGPIDKTFDYLVPARLAPLAAVGTLVRVRLHGRRVSGWIVDVDVSPPAGVSLAELIAVRGWGRRQRSSHSPTGRRTVGRDGRHPS